MHFITELAVSAWAVNSLTNQNVNYILIRVRQFVFKIFHGFSQLTTSIKILHRFIFAHSTKKILCKTFHSFHFIQVDKMMRLIAYIKFHNSTAILLPKHLQEIANNGMKQRVTIPKFLSWTWKSHFIMEICVCCAQFFWRLAWNWNLDCRLDNLISLWWI